MWISHYTGVHKIGTERGKRVARLDAVAHLESGDFVRDIVRADMSLPTVCLRMVTGAASSVTPLQS
jgi:hypothetical protein